VPELRPGSEIGDDYAAGLLQAVRDQNGVIFLAKDAAQAVGLISAWVALDDDTLLEEEARVYACISDIFVIEAWRGKRVAQALLDAAEASRLNAGARTFH
jgi:GNAT superfamily N-acetyltransferase